jgi:hypothetical protein
MQDLGHCGPPVMRNNSSLTFHNFDSGVEVHCKPYPRLFNNQCSHACSTNNEAQRNTYDINQQ